MRSLYCGMIFSTAAPTGEVAAWLNANCVGQWDLHPASVAHDGVTKKFMILFEQERDRVNFETRFTAEAAASA